ncbi:universal stress protein [Mucilaginibacter sp. UR6-1]|uniref:universal stress protein n=1 Tax=Mucilaginibacter sp. UR6-1 TaxID=1435643 RepID=UPI001E64F097|nr:universal stress protein [Mucilaginibacter sp. UR6-1]MCC8408518.1 universal stress protein [Mucilaginibacter sp. UR6-1]
MKTLFVPTDFSAAAENAAQYALAIAQATRANVKLFNVFMVAAATPMAAQVAWPLYNYEAVVESTNAELNKLANKLTNLDDSRAVEVLTSCESAAGNVAEMINQKAVDERACMVVMGTSGSGDVQHFFLGSTSNNLISKIAVPLLLVPPKYQFKPIKRIAIATDLSDSEIEVIQSVASLAKYFNAELVLFHVTDDKYEPEYAKKIDVYLREVTNRINYSNVFYRHVKSTDVNHGVEWIVEHGLVDMLAIIHQEHNFFDKLFSRSHTHHAAKHIDIPLLVYPCASKRFIAPAF